MKLKQTGVDFLESNIDWMLLKNCSTQYKMIINSAKKTEALIAQEYAEFCVRCHNEGLDVIEFNDWLNIR